MDILKSSDNTVGFLKKALDLRSQRHKHIASNVANVDTPGYKSKNITFEGQMGEILESEKGTDMKMKRTDTKHFPVGSGKIEKLKSELVTDDSPGGLDGNNVDMDKEMAELAKNSLLYNAVTQLIGEKFERIKYAIDQGGR